MKRVSERFPNLRAAAAFYGIAHGQFTELKKMGADNADPLPFEDPQAMVPWFGRMIDCGARKRPCPSSVLTRAMEARGEAPVTPAPAAHRAKPRPAMEGDLPPLVLNAESTPSDIISRQRQLHAALNVRYLEMVATRQDQTAEGMAVYRQITSLEKAILDWSKAERDLRDPDEWIPIREVQEGAAAFCKGMVDALRREISMHFPASDYDRLDASLDALAARMPTILQMTFGKAAA